MTPPVYRGTLENVLATGRALVAALTDAKRHEKVRDSLPADFVRRFARRLELLTSMNNDIEFMIGLILGYSCAAARAAADVSALSRIARVTAIAAFVGRRDFVRSTFGVGAPHPRNTTGLIVRATDLLDACRKHEAELAPHGWGPRQNAALAAALDAVNEARALGAVAADSNDRLMIARSEVANAFYRECRAVQRAADAVYLHTRRVSPAVLEGRHHFLLK